MLKLILFLKFNTSNEGILMGTGDQIAQNFVEKRKFKDLDFKRTGQFALIGLCITVIKLLMIISTLHTLSRQHRQLTLYIRFMNGYNNHLSDILGSDDSEMV